MGDLCKILIQNGRRFITHSPTISKFSANLNKQKIATMTDLNIVKVAKKVS